MGSDTGDKRKVLHVWAKPVENSPASQPTDGQDQPDPFSTPPARPTLSDAISTIHARDLVNVASVPCARNSFLIGITAGALTGGILFVARGKVPQAANWAAGMFVTSSMASYEYCHYQKRAQRTKMKRHIEVVSEQRQALARRVAEEQQLKARLEEEAKAAQKPWYKPW